MICTADNSVEILTTLVPFPGTFAKDKITEPMRIKNHPTIHEIPRIL